MKIECKFNLNQFYERRGIGECLAQRNARKKQGVASCLLVLFMGHDNCTVVFSQISRSSLIFAAPQHYFTICSKFSLQFIHAALQHKLTR